MDGAIYPSDDVILDYKLKSVSAIDSINSVTRVFALHTYPSLLKLDACSELICNHIQTRVLLSYSFGISLLFYLHLPAACLLPSSLLLTNICTILTQTNNRQLTQTTRVREETEMPPSPPVYRRGISREDGDVFSRLGAGTSDPTPGGSIRDFNGRVRLVCSGF